MYSEHSDLLSQGRVSACCYTDPKIRKILWVNRNNKDFLKHTCVDFVLLEFGSGDYKECTDDMDLSKKTSLEHLIKVLTKPFNEKDEFTLGFGLLPITEKMLLPGKEGRERKGKEKDEV
jgi:hypothetical protein